MFLDSEKKRKKRNSAQDAGSQHKRVKLEVMSDSSEGIQGMYINFNHYCLNIFLNHSKLQPSKFGCRKMYERYKYLIPILVFFFQFDIIGEYYLFCGKNSYFWTFWGPKITKNDILGG